MNKADETRPENVRRQNKMAIKETELNAKKRNGKKSGIYSVADKIWSVLRESYQKSVYKVLVYHIATLIIVIGMLK